MKIQIASDLHLENWQRDLPPLHLFTPDRTRDLLILAGDVTDGKTDFGLPFIRRELEFSPVIYVPGNHEYYFAPSRQKVDDGWRALQISSGVLLPERRHRGHRRGPLLRRLLVLGFLKPFVIFVGLLLNKQETDWKEKSEFAG